MLFPFKFNLFDIYRIANIFICYFDLTAASSRYSNKGYYLIEVFIRPLKPFLVNGFLFKSAASDFSNISYC